MMPTSFIVLMLSVFGALTPDQQATLRACDIGPAELDTYLAMDQQAFDQDMDGGWRAVSFREGCKPAAAILIETYLHFSQPTPVESQGILRWHAGQVWAGIGETERALAFFRGTYHDGPGAAGDEWDQYVDATIAFLENDLAALKAARTRLAAMVPSEEQIARARAFFESNPETAAAFPNWEVMITQPQNLDVVDGLIACFGRPYSEAYGADCR